jgi:hypothetical protein
MPALLMRTIAGLGDNFGQPTHLGEGRKIRRYKYRRACSNVLDLIDYLFASIAIASVDQDVRTLTCQLPGHQPAHAVCRTGDQCGLVFEVHGFEFVMKGAVDLPFYSATIERSKCC